ncbi:MAG: T9SS type A sorting domain-containing protein [Bacteroidota bacterium]
MKKLVALSIICLLVVSASTVYGQMIKRTDVVWARTTSNPITLDGKLLEADWAKAESLTVKFGADNGMPGSGYNTDGYPVIPPDPINAVVKFLVNGDSLYIAVIAKDSSIGAGLWPGPAKWEGILANIKNRASADRPVPAGEIYYAWNSEGWADPNTANVGATPGYFGPYGGYNRWTDSAAGLLKAQIWDAKTFVDGVTNADSVIDKGYTMEFKINLKFYGYNPKDAAGDIVMFSLSIYDADWQWYRGADTVKNRFTINKAWLQGPWGNASVFGHVRVHVNPAVTVTSGAVPTVGPDLVIPGGGSYAVPAFDGKLDDAVWKDKSIGKLLLRWGNAPIRNAYPGTAPYRSGQFQPDVNGGKAAVIDGDTATIKYFYKGDTLYIGFDVKDKVVQSVPGVFDRWDGFRVMINARNARNGDSVLITRRFTFTVDSAGNATRQEDLSQTGWDSLGQAVQVKLALKPGTTVDTLGATPDAGYTAEMKIALTKLGYPAGRGDGVVFFGVCMFDGDSFNPPTTSYGYRVWFMREQDWQDGAAWMWMDPNAILSVGENYVSAPKEFKLIGNYPNPFNPMTTIKFSMPTTDEVMLEVYDILGRLVALQPLGVRYEGEQEVTFNASHLASGVYNYRLRTTANKTVVGRMMLVK